MHALGAGEDLGAAHVEVVAVAVGGGGGGGGGWRRRGRGGGGVWWVWRESRGGHCVEGADSEGILVEDVEVGGVLFEDETAEEFFLGCAGGFRLCERLAVASFKRLDWRVWVDGSELT